MNQTPGNTSSARAMAAFAVGTLFFLYAFVQRVSPSVMTTELMREFAVGASGIGLLSGMYFYTYASLQLPVGLMVDRFGPKRLLVISASVCAVACVGFAYSHSLWQASIFRALIGGSVAFAFVGTLAIAAAFFSRSRFGLLAGLLLATGMVGAIAGQAPLRVLVESVGWRECFFVLSFLATCLALCSLWIIPTIEKRQSIDAPMSSVWQQIRQVILNRQTLLCAVGGFGFAAPMLSFAGLWAVPWLTTTKAYSQIDASGVVSSLFFGVMLGSPLMGWVSDALGRRKVVLLGGAAVCLMTFALIVYVPIQSPLWLSALFFLHGIGAGTMVVLMGLCREWNKPGHSATALGFVNMGIVSSGALMQPVLGLLLDFNWSGVLDQGARVYSADTYTVAFHSLMLVLIVASICIVLLKESYCEQQVN